MVKFFKPKANKQSIGQLIEIDIVRFDLNGAGIGYLDNKPVFVEQALIGERVLVKVVEQKSKFLRAKVIDIVSKAEQRVTPKCQHFQLCGGCDLQHMNIATQLSFKQDKIVELFRRNNLDSSLPWQSSITGNEWHYRRKARIGVQYSKKGEIIVGFRQKNTNKLTRIKSCPVFELHIAEIFEKIKSSIEALSVEKAISHVDIITTDAVTLVFRHTKSLSSTDIDLLRQEAKLNDWQLFLDDGQSVNVVAGSDELNYSIEQCKITFNSKNFIQVNHKVNCLMVQQAISWLQLSKRDSILDLFCGLGNFSLPVAKLVNSVVAIEGVDEMVLQAQHNAASNNIENVEFYQADLEASWQSHNWRKRSYNKVILDPARAGALNAVNQLCSMNIKQILYISCDPSTLARDSKVLIEHGYTIEKIALMDMFSQTKHVETMVLFNKSK